MVGGLILQFEVKVMVLKGKFSLVLIKLLVNVLHFFIGRELHLLNYMLLIILVLFLEIFKLDPKSLLLPL